MVSKYNFKYSGSIFWVVFWAMFYFPIAIFNLLLKGTFESTEASYYFEYSGSIFWLGFWMIFFFPIGFVLIFANGLALCKKDMPSS